MSVLRSSSDLSTQRVIDSQYVAAKSFLHETSAVTGLNLYDHLSRVLTKILDEKPQNAVDVFEDYSRNEKQPKSVSSSANASAADEVESKTELALAEIQEKLFSKGDGEDDIEVEDEYPIPNIMELSFFFEQAGIGLNREEMFRVGMALKNLTENHPLEHARFWGKIFGTEDSYLVAEVEYREGDNEEDEDDVLDEASLEQEREVEENEEEDDTPKAVHRVSVVPREEMRTGANKKTYFVCNELGKPWTRLPYVTPAQITAARKIKKFFTGRLDAPINSYPPFPGNEANYLRAQIARISAGTHISPLGFYQFDEEDANDDDDGALPDNFIINTEFEPIPARELAGSALTSWVHHVQHILPQGRCSWWNPKDEEEEEEPESDAENERPSDVDPQPEIGPPLLSPLSGDADVNGMTPWTTHLSSRLVPQFAVAVVRSCLWPGAHAFAFGKIFENIYIGWGHKYSAHGFSPVQPAPVQDEYPTEPKITEVDDPTPEEEAAAREGQEDEDPDDQEDDGNYDDDDD